MKPRNEKVSEFPIAIKGNKTISRIVLTTLLGFALLPTNLLSEVFLDSPTQLSPFIEQNVMGVISPLLITTSPALYHNRAFSAFAVNNDLTFAYHPTDLPDVFSGGLSFNQSIDRTFFISGAAQVYLVGSLQNISDATFNRYGDFSYLNLTPSLAMKIFPGLAVAIQSEISFFTVLGDRKSDVNLGVSSAFEFKTESTFFNTLRFGLNGRNLLGLGASNMLPFELLGSAGFISANGVFSTGVGLSFQPKVGSGLENKYSLDWGASLFMFDLWRFNFGVVGIGQNTVNLNVSTSVDISFIRLAYGLQNLIPTQGAITRGSGLDQIISVAFFYKMLDKTKNANKVAPVEDPQVQKARQLETMGEL